MNPNNRQGDPNQNRSENGDEAIPPHHQYPYNSYYNYFIPPQYYPPPQNMYYSPFEQYQPQNEVTNPTLLRMFANAAPPQHQMFDQYNMFGPPRMMFPHAPTPQYSQEKQIENVLKAMILQDDGSREEPKIEEPQPAVAQNAVETPAIVEEQVANVKKIEVEKQPQPTDGKKKKRAQNATRKPHVFDQSRKKFSDDMLIMPDLKLNRDCASKITKVLIKLYKDLAPTQQELLKKEKFFERLSTIVKGRWPDAELNLFGSSASSLCVRGSWDIDICLVVKLIPNTRKRSNSKTQPVVDAEPQKIIPEPEVDPEVDEDDNDDQEPAQQSTSTPQKGVRRKKGFRKVPLTEEQALKKNYVSQLTQVLEKHQMRQIKPLFNARVPIVKFVDPDSSLNVDICVNNILAVHNTRLLKEYATFDQRCSQLIYVVKYWASMREINHPYHGTLSSYSYTLLVIHYLQRGANPPVLPVLQDKEQFDTLEFESNMVDGLDASIYDCSYFDPSKITQEHFPKRNTELVGDLLVGFFKYYAFIFDFNTDIICIRYMEQTVRSQHEDREYITKEEKGWTNYAEVRNAMCIEDPFETNYNVSRTCSRDGLAQIQYELVRAYHMLCKQQDLKINVCARLSINKS
ncbi:uridylyltransferase [Acrasis kona]|uniref:RNA uridylyltransferase n=1 Tax=Acrasis kona TaxID=1008807 RepID=A0AAW2ZA61_9EUKA